MIGKGVGPRMCSRCGARVDERRGRNTTVCLVCGNPLPPPAGDQAKAKGSNTIAWLLGVIGVCVLLMFGLGTVIAILVLRSDSTKTDDPVATPIPSSTSTVSPINTSTASPTSIPSITPTSTETPSASASVKPPPPSLSDEERDELPGSYTCSIDDTPAFRCQVRNGILEKLDGSQRFRGPVSKIGGGNLSFSGTYFCPFGACTRTLPTMTFVRQSPGRYVGRFAKSSSPGSGGGNERVTLTKVGR